MIWCRHFLAISSTESFLLPMSRNMKKNRFGSIFEKRMSLIPNSLKAGV